MQEFEKVGQGGKGKGMIGVQGKDFQEEGTLTLKVWFVQNHHVVY